MTIEPIAVKPANGAKSKRAAHEFANLDASEFCFRAPCRTHFWT
jgi:hypothetical protein